MFFKILLGQCYFHTNGVEITKISGILYISFCYFSTIGVEKVKAGMEPSDFLYLFNCLCTLMK
jgi:hypothetical protein